MHTNRSNDIILEIQIMERTCVLGSIYAFGSIMSQQRKLRFIEIKNESLANRKKWNKAQKKNLKILFSALNICTANTKAHTHTASMRWKLAMDYAENVTEYNI